MRFRIDGRDYEFTFDDVRARLRGKTPGPVAKHWVIVEGVRWPVKQALREVLGGPGKSPRFQSVRARGIFRSLGLEVSEEGGSIRRAAHAAFDETSLPELETVSASVSFTWHKAGEVVLDGDGFPKFPALPKLPGLYRFEFTGGSRSVLYIGESESLTKRASQYRNAKRDRPRARTSRRIHKELVTHLSAGGTVTFAIATRVEAGVDEHGQVDLRRKSARRMAENAAVLLAQLNRDVDVLNIDADLPVEDGVASD